MLLYQLVKLFELVSMLLISHKENKLKVSTLVHVWTNFQNESLD